MMHSKNKPTLFRILIAILSISTFLTASLSASEKSSPFSRIISFGDSLSDTGNLYAASGGAFPPASLGYFNGRTSNGTLWNEYLAEDLKSSLTLENNYSYFGAQTGDGNFSEGTLPFPLIGLTDQIDQYLNDTPSGSQPRDLFLIWIGANDFFAFLEKGEAFPIPNGIQNTLYNVERLLKGGARHLVALTVPDLSKTPAFSLLSPDDKALLSGLCATYNTYLSQSLNALAASYNCHLVIVDTFSIINQIIANPDLFGIANTTIPAFLGADPNVSLFWDYVHPTTKAHRIVADFAIDAMIESYATPKGIPFEADLWFTTATIANGQ